jgi:outer membrane protein
MKKAILLLFLLSAFVPVTSYAAEYSLEDLYALALERNETIKIAEEGLYISERDKDRAMAVLIPTFSAFGSHTEYSYAEQGLQPDSSTSWGLKINQSLSLSGRELKALNIAKEGIVKTGLDLDSVKELYMLNIASAYYDLLKAKKALEIANSNVERLTKHRDAANTRLRVGETTKTTLLRAEAELAGAQSELIKAENALKLSKTTLARTVGITGDYDVKESVFSRQESGVKENNLPFDKGEMVGFSVDCGLSAVECLKQTAFSERQELRALEIDKKIADDRIKYTNGLYWPNISIEGVYSKKEDYPNPTSANNENIYGVLRLDFPFFEGGLRMAEVRQAKARLRQSEYRLADTRNTVAVEVESAYLNLLTESGVLDKMQAELEYARDNYNAVSKQFEFGLANSIDVMDANNLLVTSERQLANTRYDYQLAILKLKRATGTLLKTVVSRQESGVSRQ